MSTFDQMISDCQLAGMGKLLAADFGALINRAQREEVEAYPWSWLLTNLVLNTAPVQNAGTVSVSPNSNLVSGVGTAFVLPPRALSFIHIGTSNIAIPIANVLSTTSLTMGTAWGASALNNQAYNIITPVYSIAGFIEVYQIRQIELLTKRSREYINRQEPARLAVGGNPSTDWCPYGFDSAGNINIEIWPPPSAAMPYLIEGKLAAATMVQGQNQQPQLPSSVLVNKAMSMACDALFAGSGEDKWGALSDKYWKIYLGELEKAQTADVARQNQRADGNAYSPGLDFYASHDTTVIR